MSTLNIEPGILPPDCRKPLDEICRRFGVRWLAVFGSVARGEATPESDVDLLVEYHLSAKPTLLDLVDLADTLSPLFGGRRVDLGLPSELHRVIREAVVKTSKVLYAA